MEQQLKEYIEKEYGKLETEEEQRGFIEKFRFLMMAKDRDFANYYSKRSLDKTAFYQIADMLYELNNLWMLSEFIHENRQVLWNEVQEISESDGKPDFSTPCRLGRDTMFSRMFQVIGSYGQRECRIAEAETEYENNTHHLKVHTVWSNNRKSVPQISLQGKWVEKWGFSVGTDVCVDCYHNRVVIRKNTV